MAALVALPVRVKSAPLLRAEEEEAKEAESDVEVVDPD